MLLSINNFVCDYVHALPLSLPRSTWNRGWKVFRITWKNSANCSETKAVWMTCSRVHHESAVGVIKWFGDLGQWPIRSLHPTSFVCLCNSFLSVGKVKSGSPLCSTLVLGDTSDVWKLQNQSVRRRATVWATVLVGRKQARQEQEH